MGEVIGSEEVPVIQPAVQEAYVFVEYIFLMVQLWDKYFGPCIHVAGDAAEFCIGTIVVARP